MAKVAEIMLFSEYSTLLII